jgi:hypothetical protein
MDVLAQTMLVHDNNLNLIGSQSKTSCSYSIFWLQHTAQHSVLQSGLYATQLQVQWKQRTWRAPQ